MSMMWLWTIPALVFIGAIALLWLGLRGRRVDDHPICRRCGFDLFGRPEGSVVCSECGGDLTQRRAIRDGRRIRRGGMIAIGALFLAITLTVGGGAGYAAYSIKDLQPYKPVWWLVRELDRGDPPTRSAAIAELLGRLANSKLAQPEIDQVADRMLDLQADAKRPWHSGCGDFLEAARAAKRLSNERWERYGRQAMQLTLDVRPWVRRGDVIPFQIRTVGSRRVGSRSTAFFQRSVSVLVGGERFNSRPLLATQRIFDPPSPPWVVDGSVGEQDYGVVLGDGAHDVRVSVDLAIDSPALGRRPSAPVIASVELTGQTKLFPAHESTVLLLQDEALREPVHKAIHTTATLDPTRSGRMVDIVVSCKSPPVGVGCVVVAVVDGRMVALGMIACPAKQDRYFGFICNAPNGDHGEMVIAYYPTPRAAAGSIDTFEIWNEMWRETISVSPAGRPAPRSTAPAPPRWATTTRTTPTPTTMPITPARRATGRD
jgi:hypothetical protein